MKNLVIIIFLTLGIGSVNAQKLNEADVPAVVKESFKKAFPNVKVQKWEKEGDMYEAEYTIDKIEHSATMNAAGNVMETEMRIKISELPKPVSDYVSKNMPGKKINEASQITTAEGLNNYEVEIDGTDHMFDANGKLLKEEENKN